MNSLEDNVNKMYTDMVSDCKGGAKCDDATNKVMRLFKQAGAQCFDRVKIAYQSYANEEQKLMIEEMCSNLNLKGEASEEASLPVVENKEEDSDIWSSMKAAEKFVKTASQEEINEHFTMMIEECRGVNGCGEDVANIIQFLSKSGAQCLDQVNIVYQSYANEEQKLMIEEMCSNLNLKGESSEEASVPVQEIIQSDFNLIGDSINIDSDLS